MVIIITAKKIKKCILSEGVHLYRNKNCKIFNSRTKLKMTRANFIESYISPLSRKESPFSCSNETAILDLYILEIALVVLSRYYCYSKIVELKIWTCLAKCAYKM